MTASPMDVGFLHLCEISNLQLLFSLKDHTISIILQLLDPAIGTPIPTLYTLEEIGYDGTSRRGFFKSGDCLNKGSEVGDKIPTDVCYWNGWMPTYQERISDRIPAYLEKPPARQIFGDSSGKPVTSIGRMLE